MAETIRKLQIALMKAVSEAFNEWYSHGLYDSMAEFDQVYAGQDADVSLDNDLTFSISISPQMELSYTDVRNCIVGSRVQDAFNLAIEDAYSIIEYPDTWDGGDIESFKEQNQYGALLLPSQDCKILVNGVETGTIPWCYNTFIGGAWC